MSGRKRQLRHSIRVQLAGVFIVMLVAVVALAAFSNTAFLQRYYISNKQRQIESSYDTMNLLSERFDASSEDFSMGLDKLTTDGNLLVVVADSGMNILYSTEREAEMMASRLLWRMISGDPMNEPGAGIEDMIASKGYIEEAQGEAPASGNNVGRRYDKIKERTLATTDAYRITTSTDPAMRSDYIELWGYLSNGDLIFIRSPLESIRESAAISTRFMLYIGIIIAVFGAIVMWFVSKRITDPILELTDISDRMAHLDFDARYETGGMNEIGELGRHINEMSSHLENTISELKTANNELQQDIAKREKMESMRSEFISNVSHELKTPIALVSGYAEGLRDGIADDEESRNEYLDVIIDESDKMASLVSSLLELNHIEFGDDPVEMKRFDVAELVAGVIESSDIIARQFGARIEDKIEGALHVWSDESKVETVFTNFLTNAIHYCGGEKRIEVRRSDAGGDVRIEVYNTGEKIPEESIDRIWDKFYKVDKARTREVGGTGVGLSIVKAIMETLNKPFGVINYDDGVGFWFELERADGKQGI